jgi:hypothetical protein
MKSSSSFSILSVGTLLLATTGAVKLDAEQNATPLHRKNVHVLLYDSNDHSSTKTFPASPSSLEFFKERSEIANIRTTVYGGKSQHDAALPSNTKLQLLRPLLEVFPNNDDQLVIVGDADHVALNVPEQRENAVVAVERFVKNFQQLTQNAPNAVVIAADESCCVPAMSHNYPDQYFSKDGMRGQRSCVPGKNECHAEENDKTEMWKAAMQHHADDTLPKGIDSTYVYLNSGLVAGNPQDLIRLLDILDLDQSEDDEAVLSGLLLSRPELIVLDYQQELFGTTTCFQTNSLKTAALCQKTKIHLFFTLNWRLSR